MIETLELDAEVPGFVGIRVTMTGTIIGRRGRPLTLQKDPRSGHLHVMIDRRKLRVHHAVLEAFVGPRPAGALGRHLDDDPTNNHYSNLAWGNDLENAADRRRNRGYPIRLTDDQVRAILADDRQQCVLAAEYGVSPTTIYKIRAGIRRPQLEP